MKLPRKDYPSDHRRWLRLAEDILDDAGYRGLSSHDKVAWIDLLATFNRRKAHQRGNTVLLAWSAAMQVMGVRHRAGVVATASRLRRACGASFARTPHGLLCLIPKWSEFQGLTPTKLRRDSDETPSPTPTPTHKIREERSFSASALLEDPSSQDQRKIGADAPEDPLGEDKRLLNLLAKSGRDATHRTEGILQLERRLWLIDHLEAIRAAADQSGSGLPAVALAWWSRYLARRLVPGDYGAAPVREYYRRALRIREPEAAAAERTLIEQLDRETEAEGVGIFLEGFS